MWSVTKSFKVKLGGNYYIDCGSLIDFKGTPLFILKRRDEDGLLGIDFDIYDANRTKVATVRHGTIVDGNREAYELKHGPHHYTVIDRKDGRVICEIKRAGQSADSELEVSVDMFTPSGFHLIANPDQTNVAGNFLKGNLFKNCGVGVAVN
jgi:hypothetical protein